MFEGMPSTKRQRKLKWNKQALLIWGAAVLVLIPGGYIYWRHQNQVQARETVETISRALAVYHEKHNGYPDTLERLRGAESSRPAETAPPEQARLLPTWQARDAFQAGGYQFRYETTKRVRRWAATVPLYVAYRISAEPASVFTGRWHYGSNESGEPFEARTRQELQQLLLPPPEITATPAAGEAEEAGETKP